MTVCLVEVDMNHLWRKLSVFCLAGLYTEKRKCLLVCVFSTFWKQNVDNKSGTGAIRQHDDVVGPLKTCGQDASACQVGLYGIGVRSEEFLNLGQCFISCTQLSIALCPFWTTVFFKMGSKGVP